MICDYGESVPLELAHKLSASTAMAYEIFNMPEAEVVLYHDFFGPLESDGYLRDLSDNIRWKQDRITMYGKSIALPRLTAWYGDEDKAYTYSGVLNIPHPWTPTLLAIKHTIEEVAGAQFNSVLLNLYRNEHDSVGWHSDDEPELGRNPVIGSVSFGATRRFQLKHKRRRGLRKTLDLSHGSLLLMGGLTQHCWYHRIPKSTEPCKPRINLTFRYIKAILDEREDERSLSRPQKVLSHI
jgi:Alkylated DNA repair protein